jgi:hypothetical protein
MRKVKLTQKVKKINYIDNCQRQRYESYTRLPMTIPESRDKLDSTLTPKLLNLTLESEKREENSFCVCYKL